jgi:GPH family glycoside/pentoside/hexuronide:cation symporter
MERLPGYAQEDTSLHLFFVKIQSSFGGGLAVAAFWMSVGLGGIIIISGILPAIICREKVKSQHQTKIHIFSAIVYTLKNRPFMILCIAYIIIIFGLFAPGTLGLYVNIYYVFGSKEGAAFLLMLLGPLGAATSYLSLFLISWISVRWDKRIAMITGLLFTLVSICSLWFTLTPKMPYLQLVSAFISYLGLQGCWLMISSMVADVCDEDELKTGLRREGVYGAVNGLAMKAALAFTMIAGGAMIKLSGYDPKVAESVGSISIEIAMRMKILMIGGQAAMIALATVIFLFYPITRQRAEETRRILDQRRNQAKNSAESTPSDSEFYKGS